MSFAKRVVIAVDPQLNLDQVFSSVSELSFLGHCEIHFVHVCPVVKYPVVLSGMTMIFPIEDDRMDIEKGVVGELRSLSKTLFPSIPQERLHHHCLFSENPKMKCAEFVTAEKMDLVIIAAREKHGLFESSFVHYMSKHTKANLIVIKHA